ncbi:DUF3300 domain-containing protein [Shewanella schlegeliana]|uniref:DUF3300 domain-containing protein n=1 Tax=Shewanella schlegeliana TaxID=190308 RepID=A0ABS1SY50_9GAMM|nr:DUF3300 domain-containing protein [Shewanella schlegeliana]MBL4913485.1 DUF3300 domain-containing protein [Shewanella schlegeliana]MCL1108375.1 DUF3300 domain-containing protein [Shewanella schlegeliana]
MNRFNRWCWSLIITLAIAMPLMMSANTVKAQEHEYSQYTEGQLAQMLAPIALYPDSLLTHILIASTYPLEVVQAHRWQVEHNNLSTQKQIDKAQDKDWDPSVVALIAFPNVLQKLSEDLNWTQSLGDAFLQDEAQVLASIQTLRQEADNANSLEQMDNMQVTRISDQIIIEPVRKEIVYVPYYDPRTVYGYWRWYNYPPIYWAVYPGYVRPSYGHFYWRAGVHISFNYYFSAFHWHKRHVVVVHHHNSHRYRHHGRIVTSHGAKRWAHKPQHRRGVAYSNNALRHKYNSHYPSRAQSKALRHNSGKHVNHKMNSHKRINSPERVKSHDRLKSQIRGNSPERINSHERVKSHEQIKSQIRGNSPLHNNSHERVKNHQRNNSHQQHFVRSSQPKTNKSYDNRAKHQGHTAKPARNQAPRSHAPRSSNQHKPRKE